MAPNLSVTIVAFLAVLYLVAAVDASTYRTTITTTTTEERQNRPCKSAESCDESINNHEFTNCEGFILGTEPSNLLTCCSELFQLDENQCRCDALQKIVKKGGSDEEAKRRAQTTVIYCRMGTPQGCISDAVSL